jgi:hypothetical protein
MNAKRHFLRAQQHRAFHTDLVDITTQYPRRHYDWAIVGMFYEVVHIVEGYRHGQGRGDSTDHGERATFLAINCPESYEPYEALSRGAFYARYTDRPFGYRDVAELQEKLTNIRGYFELLDAGYRAVLRAEPRR